MIKNIAVIGLGSMGKRRIRLIKEKFHDQVKMSGIDIQESRRTEVEKEFSICTYSTISESFKEHTIDYVFVCTSPLSHSLIISECLDYGTHVFTELNLVNDGYELNLQKAKERNIKIFLSATFIYRAEPEYICRKAKNERLQYNYHVGQYLPDWHPWENYNNYFVSKSRTNACREIFAIELPWLIRAFGDIAELDVQKSKISTLKVDYNDSFSLLVRHKTNVVGTLSVDVVSRKPVRNFELYGENLYLTWDGSPSGLQEYNFASKTMHQVSLYNNAVQLDNYATFVVEDAYSNEIDAFFDYVQKGIEPRYTFEDDKRILSLIDEIEGNK
ncbi:MAG: Gfo/Idh/MocA family oxidoreductase [Clostridiales bacterium]|jgi:predicted dehydrogenase|nr:Gfo/Idh/MocA family oxidoreductase [Clostridiales bacterium]